MSIGVLPTADIFAEPRARQAVERDLREAEQASPPARLSPRASLLLWGLLSGAGWAIVLAPLWLILG